MVIINIIAAVGDNLELGKDNDLIWHIKRDLQHFKEQTLGKKIVMGYNTFKSLPKPLPNRMHIVLTSHTIEQEGIMTFDALENLIHYLNSLNEEVYIIGGSTIYKEFLPYADTLYLTEINDSANADCYFPTFDKTLYKKESIEEHLEHIPPYSLTMYRKKHHS